MNKLLFYAVGNSDPRTIKHSDSQKLYCFDIFPLNLLTIQAYTKLRVIHDKISLQLKLFIIDHLKN